MTTHHNFDHANPTYVPQGGHGRIMRCHFTGRDWCGSVGALMTGGAVDVHHMPSPQGLPAAALKAVGWKLEF